MTAREVIAEWLAADVPGGNTAENLLFCLHGSGYVIVPKNDIRPYPLLLDEDVLVGLVAHLTAGTADVSLVRLQISRMRAAAQEPKT